MFEIYCSNKLAAVWTGKFDFKICNSSLLIEIYNYINLMLYIVICIVRFYLERNIISNPCQWNVQRSPTWIASYRHLGWTWFVFHNVWIHFYIFYDMNSIISLIHIERLELHFYNSNKLRTPREPHTIFYLPTFTYSIRWIGGCHTIYKRFARII